MRKKLAGHSKKKLSFKSFGPAITWFVVVFILIILPEDNLPGKHSWLDITYLDKFVHIFMFALLTFLFLLPVAESSMFAKEKRFYFIRIGIAACIWGITTEFIQKFYVPTRSFDLLDWAADSLGVLIAIIYCRRFHRR